MVHSQRIRPRNNLFACIVVLAAKKTLSSLIIQSQQRRPLTSSQPNRSEEKVTLVASARFLRALMIGSSCAVHAQGLPRAAECVSLVERGRADLQLSTRGHAPAERIHFILLFPVTVFGAVRPGPADEDGAVSVVHRAAV